MSKNFEDLAGRFSVVANHITHRDQTTSTMDEAWDGVRSGAPDGAVFIADHQTAGRGRYDRSWASNPAQDILCSIVLRPRVALAGELLMLAALAVCDVASDFEIQTGIKWPNDVQVDGKKLAGVIAESRTGSDQVEPAPDGIDRIDAVVGIGLNVNLDPSTQQDMAPNSTSLAAETDGEIDRKNVFERLMQAIDERYSIITNGGSIVPDWRERLTTLGRDVVVVSGLPSETDELEGVAHDVDSIGRLIVRDASGRDWPVSAGEVTVRSIS